MKTCLWQSIHNFRSRCEFERFENWIGEQVAFCVATKIAVARPYLDASAFNKKWYCYTASGNVWRLVWPDGSFTGVFEEVAHARSAQG